MLYLHIGTHISATTLIQKNMKKYLPKNYKVISNLDECRNKKNKKMNYVLSNEGFFCWDWNLYIWGKILYKRYKITDKDLIDMDKKIKNLYFFEKTVRNMNWKNLPKICVIVYFRDPVSYLESLIQQCMKEGNIVELKNIPYDKILSSINYSKILSILRKYFDKVEFRWYETIYNLGGNGYLSKFLKIITKKDIKINKKIDFVNIGLTHDIIVNNNKRKIKKGNRKKLEIKSKKQYKKNQYIKNIVPKKNILKYKNFISKQKKKLRFQKFK